MEYKKYIPRGVAGAMKADAGLVMVMGVTGLVMLPVDRARGHG